MLVSGHVAEPRTKPNTVGAKSYFGIDEYLFNDALLALFELPDNRIENVNYRLVYAVENLELKARSKLANVHQPDLYIEIHHDSARKADRDRAHEDGLDSLLWNAFRGFSVHFSSDSAASESSERFARILGEEMTSIGFQPTDYLEKAMRMKVVDRDLGLYNRIKPHGLYIFRAIKTPVVVFEVGNIANPTEEQEISTDDMRQKVVETINRAILRFIPSD